MRNVPVSVSVISIEEKYENGNNDFEQQALNNLFISASEKYGSQDLLFGMFN